MFLTTDKPDVSFIDCIWMVEHLNFNKLLVYLICLFDYFI